MDRLFTLTGFQSCISQDFFPAIELDRNCTYALGLYSFNVYNSIPNVQSGKNDKFYFLTSDNHSMSITIPEGAYEIDALERCIHDAVLEKLEALPPDKFVGDKYHFSLKANVSTQDVKILAWFAIDFKKKNSIGSLIGFENVSIKPEIEATSNSLVKISAVDVVNIECNIIEGSYINGEPSHTLYSFNPNDVPPGYKISLRPPNVLYLPVNTDYISNITLRLVDHEFNNVNFRGEHIVVQLNLRKLD